MSKQSYWIFGAIALLLSSLVFFLPIKNTLAQFPPTISYDWKAMSQKTPQDCQKAATSAIVKLFPERVEQRKSATCGQGRGFAACVVCIPDPKLIVGVSTGPDGVQTESIVKQLLSKM